MKRMKKKLRVLHALHGEYYPFSQRKAKKISLCALCVSVVKKKIVSRKDAKTQENDFEVEKAGARVLDGRYHLIQSKQRN